MTKKASARNRRARSPRAPRLDLELALSMARRFYDKEPTRSAPSEVVIEHWGYSSKSSSGPIALSTLRGFGLIEVHGNEIRLTELALDILQDGRAESPKRIRSIRRAALYPKIHATVSEHYGGTIPSDETLRFYLLRDQGFTDKGADVFVKQFRATLAFAFAGIENGVRLPKGEGEEKEGGSATSERYPPPTTGWNRRTSASEQVRCSHAEANNESRYVYCSWWADYAAVPCNQQPGDLRRFEGMPKSVAQANGEEDEASRGRRR